MWGALSRRLACWEPNGSGAGTSWELCVQMESIADVALPSVLPGCRVRDRVPAEALPGLLGSSG